MLSGASAALYEQKTTSGLNLDDGPLSDAWARLRDDTSFGWLVCGYPSTEGGSDTGRVVLLESGAGNFADLVACLDENRVAYGAFAVRARSGDVKVRKLVSFAWVGPGVTGLARARVSMHRSAVDGYFGGTVASLSFLSKDELLNWSEVKSAIGTAAQLRGVRLGPRTARSVRDTARGAAADSDEDSDSTDRVGNDAGAHEEVEAGLGILFGGDFAPCPFIQKPGESGVDESKHCPSPLRPVPATSLPPTTTELESLPNLSAARDGCLDLLASVEAKERSDIVALLPPSTLLEVQALRTMEQPQGAGDSWDVWMSLTPPTVAPLVAARSEAFYPDVFKRLGHAPQAAPLPPSPQSKRLEEATEDMSGLVRTEPGGSLARTLLIISGDHPSGFEVVTPPPLALLLILRGKLSGGASSVWGKAFAARGGAVLLVRCMDALNGLKSNYGCLAEQLLLSRSLAVSCTNVLTSLLVAPDPATKGVVVASLDEPPQALSMTLPHAARNTSLPPSQTSAASKGSKPDLFVSREPPNDLGTKPDLGAMLAARKPPNDLGTKPDLGAMLAARMPPNDLRTKPDLGAMLAARKPSCEGGTKPDAARVHEGVGDDSVSMREDEVYGPFVRAMNNLGLPVRAAQHKLAKEHPTLDPSPLETLGPDAPAPRPRPLLQKAAPVPKKEHDVHESNVGALDDTTSDEDTAGETWQMRRLFWEPMGSSGRGSENLTGSVFARVPSVAAQPRNQGLGAALRLAVAESFTVVEVKKVETEAERVRARLMGIKIY